MYQNKFTIGVSMAKIAYNLRRSNEYFTTSFNDASDTSRDLITLSKDHDSNPAEISVPHAFKT